MNQPVIQLVNKSFCQWVHQSTSQSFIKSVNQCLNQSLRQTEVCRSSRLIIPKWIYNAKPDWNSSNYSLRKVTRINRLSLALRSAAFPRSSALRNSRRKQIKVQMLWTTWSYIATLLVKGSVRTEEDVTMVTGQWNTQEVPLFRAVGHRIGSSKS